MCMFMCVLCTGDDAGAVRGVGHRGEVLRGGGGLGRHLPCDIWFMLSMHNACVCACFAVVVVVDGWSM